MDYCRPYAAQTSQLLLTWAWQRAYTSCLNSDDDPLVPETAQGALQVIAPTPASPFPEARPVLQGEVPATDPKDELEIAQPKAKFKPKAKLAGGQPQALCFKHGKKTVYNGLHWRCVR